MSTLDKLQNEIELALRSIGVEDTPLYALGKSKEYKLMYEKFQKAITEQIDDVVNEQLFELIHSKISKVDDIFTESDEIEIYESTLEEVAKNPISNYISDTLILGYLITVFEKGGQNFLNKHNLPKNFVLTNENIKSVIKSRPAKLFKGMDESTSKWISNQISDGKKLGIDNKQIVEVIREKIPTYTEFRAETVVRTESAVQLADAEQMTAERNGASHKDWVTAGDDRVSDECYANEAQGTIGIKSAFTSGAFVPPQHPNCRCVLDYYFTPFQGFIWSGE